MGPIDKLWVYFGLVRVPDEAGDKVLELQYRHLQKNIPWLYLVLIFDICSCIYAVTDSSSIILRIIIPVVVTTATLSRMLLWLRRRNSAFEAEKALSQIRSAALAAVIIGTLCALWSVLAWQWETSNFRYYIPAFLALGAFSTAYCLSLVPRSAIVSVLIGVLPICTLLFMSGIMIDFALAATMIACTLFLIGHVRRQYRQMVQMTGLQIQMHKMAHTDALTGLYNRRAFHEQLDEAFELHGAEHGTTLAMFDLDGFKQINDIHGHVTGDRLLQIAAKRLADSLGQFGKVARLGGDEFAAIFANQSPIFCSQLIEAAIEKLQKPADIDGKQLSVGVSFGLTSIDAEDDVQAIDLISQTDLLLYEMKKQRLGVTHRRRTETGVPGKRRAA